MSPTTLNIKSVPEMQRYHALYELRWLRARVRIGTVSVANARKERVALQRVLLKLRCDRIATTTA